MLSGTQQFACRVCLKKTCRASLSFFTRVNALCTLSFLGEKSNVRLAPYNFSVVFLHIKGRYLEKLWGYYVLRYLPSYLGETLLTFLYFFYILIRRWDHICHPFLPERTACNGRREFFFRLIALSPHHKGRTSPRRGTNPLRNSQEKRG